VSDHAEEFHEVRLAPETARRPKAPPYLWCKLLQVMSMTVVLAFKPVLN